MVRARSRMQYVPWLKLGRSVGVSSRMLVQVTKPGRESVARSSAPPSAMLGAPAGALMVEERIEGSFGVVRPVVEGVGVGVVATVTLSVVVGYVPRWTVLATGGTFVETWDSIK